MSFGGAFELPNGKSNMRLRNSKGEDGIHEKRQGGRSPVMSAAVELGTGKLLFKLLPASKFP